MSQKLYEENNIQDIADAIREKNGTQNTYTVSQMGNAVRAIVSGEPNLQEKTAIQNGIVLPDPGYDGLSKVTVDVSGESIPDVETNGLVVYFDGLNNTGTGHNSSSSIWKDLSGNNNDGNVINGNWGRDALIFNGSSSFVAIGQLNPNIVTLEAFACFFGMNASLWGPSIASNLEGGGYGIVLHGGKIACTVNVSGEYRINEISQPITNVYFLIAMTFDGMTLKLYVNGELINSTSESGSIQPPTLNTILALGTNPQGASGGAAETFFNGKIRTFRMYNRALSATEIKNNYRHDVLTY